MDQLVHKMTVSVLTLSLLCITCLRATVSAQISSGSSIILGPSTFTAPGRFPTSLFKHYYNNPTATSEQPQPVITDPVLVSLDDNGPSRDRSYTS